MSKNQIKVSTPSRICLFGEHLDYLGLEVISQAVDLRFFATINDREDNLIKIKIRSSEIMNLGDENIENKYEYITINLDEPIVYENNRDYFKSSINVLLKHGVVFDHGFDILLDSEIPIGKGMCSSSTMIIVIIKALLEAVCSDKKNLVDTIAEYAFLAEVEEFGEPGGKMDHYTSCIGNLVNLDFSNGTEINKINFQIPGCFILFDTLTQKDTIKVLSNAKNPVVKALGILKENNINGYTDLKDDFDVCKPFLTNELYNKLYASIDNYQILLKAKDMLNENDFDPVKFGKLITMHHANLKNGLGISSKEIDEILETAINAGAYGGKVNGSGGGGCVYVYTSVDKCDKIINSVSEIGYPSKVLNSAIGLKVD